MSEVPKRLAGADLQLKAPDSIAERWDVMVLAGDPATNSRAYAAALGLCWPRLRRKVPYKGNALTYGGEVIDYLTMRAEPKATYFEIIAAGASAFALCAEGLVAVEGAEGFSMPPDDEEPGQQSGGVLRRLNS